MGRKESNQTNKQTSGIYGKILAFSHQKCNFKILLVSYEK